MFKKILIILLALGTLGSAIFYELTVSQALTEAAQLKVYFLPAGKGASLIRNGQVQRLNDKTELSIGDKIKTEVNESGTFDFDGAELRIAPESALTVADQSDDTVYFSLEQGKVWVNTLLSDKKVLFKAGTIVASPGIYAAEFEVTNDGTGSVMVHDRELVAGLVRSNASFKAENYQGSFVNQLLVPFYRKLTVDQSKVDDNADDLSKLLYSKLIKEFQYDLVASADFDNDVWLKTNVAHDEDMIAKRTDDLKVQVRAHGLQVSSLDSNIYALDKVVAGFADMLTFNVDKAQQRKLDEVFTNLEDAEYLILYGRVTEAKDRLNIFGQVFATAYAAADTDFKNSLASKLLDEYRLLKPVDSLDDLFQVKTKIIELFLTKIDRSLDEDLNFTNEYLYQAQVMAEDNTQLARQNLTKFSSLLTTLIQSKKSVLSTDSTILSTENTMLDNLFLQYPQFYQENYFILKHQVETAWLDILVAGDAKDEEIRNISLAKVDLLKRGRDFFLQGYIALDDMKAVLRRLIAEIKDLQSNDSLGISGLLDVRLKDYGQFLLFINSVKPEDLRGGMIQDVYNKYVANHNGDNVTLDQAVNTFTGEVSTQQTTDASAQPMVDTQQTQDQPTHDSSVDTSAQTQQTEVLTQATEDSSVVAAPVVETQADKVSKILLGKKVKDLGIQYAYIEVAPGESGVYIFHGAILGDKIFDFYLDRASLTVTGITFANGAASIDGPVDLSNLTQVVNQ